MEKTFQLLKTYQMMLFQTKPFCFFVFSVLFLILSKGFLFGDTKPTLDGRTDRDFFGRQSVEALLVKQEKPCSNLTKLRLIHTCPSRESKTTAIFFPVPKRTASRIALLRKKEREGPHAPQTQP